MAIQNLSNCGQITQKAIRSWNEYVDKFKDSSFCHLYEWRTIMEKSFGHKSYYLVAEERGEYRGLLPMFVVKSKIFGSGIVSIPFLDYGGICSDNEKVQHELLNKTIEIAKKEKVDYIEFRQKIPMQSDFCNNLEKVNLCLSLKRDWEVVWKNLKDKVRNQVRKAKKAGLQFEIGGIEKVNLFYQVFSKNMRDLGTPVYPKLFFENIMNEFYDNTEIFLIEFRDKIIGGALAFYFKNQMEIPWASSLRKYFKYCPNNFLYWESIKRGCKRGCSYFNFGRSTKDSSNYRFKKQWV